MLIKFYGEFWNPNAVHWGQQGGTSGKLLGTIRVDKQKKLVDFWKAQGVYVLYDNFQAAYVGKAFETRIGDRIRHHLTDRFSGRWNMFSWYSTSNYLKTQRVLPS